MRYEIKETITRLPSSKQRLPRLGSSRLLFLMQLPILSTLPHENADLEQE